MNKTVFDREPDVEVLFEFNAVRIHPVSDGYRPQHLVTEDYLTTGVHHYYDVQTVSPGGSAKGTITFLTPDAYPKCLWEGKKIQIREGARTVGHATVLRVINPVLLTEEVRL